MDKCSVKGESRTVENSTMKTGDKRRLHEPHGLGKDLTLHSLNFQEKYLNFYLAQEKDF